MNNQRFFDRYQLIITITALSSMLISTILFIVMVITSTKVYDDNGALTGLIYNNVLQTIFIIFFLIQLTSIVWFIARAITYKMRVREEDSL